jgi:hypothetical protein
MTTEAPVAQTATVTTTAFDEADKHGRSGRRKALRRRSEEVFETPGAEVLGRILKGVYGKTRRRTTRELAKWLGLAKDGASVSRWKMKHGRPDLIRALCLYALFPELAPHLWLTKDELDLLAQCSLQGRLIAVEPAPNPKIQTRRRKGASAKQVTLDELIARGKPPAPPEPAPPPAEVPLPKDQLMDWVDE